MLVEGWAPRLGMERTIPSVSEGRKGEDRGPLDREQYKPSVWLLATFCGY